MGDYLVKLKGGTVQVITGAEGTGKTAALLSMCIEIVKAESYKKILIIASDNKKDFLDSFLELEVDINRLGVNDYRKRIGFVVSNVSKCRMSDYVDVEYCRINDSSDGTYASYADELMGIMDIAGRGCQAIFILEHLNTFYGHKNVHSKVRGALKRFQQIAIKDYVDIFVEIPSFSIDLAFDTLIFNIVDYISNVFETRTVSGRTHFDYFLKEAFNNIKKKYTIITTSITVDSDVEIGFAEKGINKEYNVFVIPFMGWLWKK